MIIIKLECINAEASLFYVKGLGDYSTINFMMGISLSSSCSAFDHPFLAPVIELLAENPFVFFWIALEHQKISYT